MTETLRPCPFCGMPWAEVQVAFGDGEPGEVYYAFCTNTRCEAEGPISKDKGEAIRKWNARPNADASGSGVRPQVFLDCDGVLADFDTYAEAYFGMPPRVYEAKVGSSAFWNELESKGDFYRNLPLMPDARALVDGVRHLNPTILTGCPRGNWAEAQKVAWASEHFPDVPIITCRSADKRLHAKPGDVLIDDWHQHRHRWIEMGGVFITHTDAATSLKALWAHYPSLRAALSPAPSAQGAPLTPTEQHDERD